MGGVKSSNYYAINMGKAVGSDVALVDVRRPAVSLGTNDLFARASHHHISSQKKKEKPPCSRKW